MIRLLQENVFEAGSKKCRSLLKQDTWPIRMCVCGACWVKGRGEGHVRVYKIVMLGRVGRLGQVRVPLL